MPSPRESETKQEFIKRCIPYLIREGKHPNTPKGRKTAAGECYGIYRSKRKSEEKIPVKSGLRDKKGYFCRLENSNEKYYYELDKPETKQNAVKLAEEEWVNLKVDELFNHVETLQKTEYIAPKSKSELRKGDIIVYKGKKAKILKVLEK